MPPAESDWIYCALLHVGHFYPGDPYCVGPYEYTRRAEWTTRSESALSESANSHGVRLGTEHLKVRFFLNDVAEEEVVRMGRLYAAEATEALSLSVFTPSQPQLTKVGFILNLRTGATSALRVVARRGARGSSFRIDEFATREKMALDRILATKERETSEVGGRLRRSARWHSTALSTDDVSAKLLNLWISAECLCGVNTARFLAGMSLPRSRYSQQLAPAHQRALTQLEPSLGQWTTRLAKLFEAGRKLRNFIAHEGARELEVRARLDPGNLDLLVRALELLVPRLHRLALNAVARNSRTLTEMWTSYGRLVQDATAGVPPTADAENVIWSMGEAKKRVRAAAMP